MIYDYLLTAFKVIIGLITTERLIYGAAIALGFYFLWICFSLMFSFQKKFNRNCVKLYNFVKKNKLNANDVNSVDFKASKISSGFSHGWKKFKSSETGKPSDFITRRDALDVEVTGGVLNQGKTLMRAYISIATFVLFLVNFAYLGNDATISCYLIAEAMVLPFIFFVICKVFYFVYTSVKQQLYKADIECLYELLDLLDIVFAKGSSAMMYVPQNNFVLGEDEVASPDGEEPALEQAEIRDALEEENEETQEESEKEEPENENVSDKYDFFKKKNLDVDKLISEVPNSSSSLPYINVDSDYVIKDDDAPAASKTIANLENGSALLGGMMQDMSSIRKNNHKEETENLVEEKSENESADEKSEVVSEVGAEPALDEPKSDDPFDSLGAFEVAENAESKIEEEKIDEKAEDLAEETAEVIAESESEKKEAEEEVKLEIPDVEPLEIVKPEPEVEEKEEPAEDEISDEKKESIATVVGGFKAKSKLASGGIVIERNQPISRREKMTNYEKPVEEDYSDNYQGGYEDNFGRNNGITQLSAEDNADNILNSFRSSAGGYDDYSYNAGMQGGMYNQGYGAPQYNQGYGYPQTPYGNQMNTGFGAQGYQNIQQPQGFGGYQAQAYNQDAYDEPDEDDYDDTIEEIEEVPEAPVKKAKKSPVKRSKEDEPRPRNLKKKVSKPVMAEEVAKAKTRGRPKKQVFDETVTIKNDKEFDEVLSRAEKLMKKSESGLSASQSKRIEKELKMLMDAMNKYKEGV